MTVVDLYTIQIVSGDETGNVHPGRFLLNEAVFECEQNLTDLLPPGYRARIRRWDQLDDPDELTQEEV